MLRLKNIHGLLIETNEGAAGRIEDVLFDSQTLNAKYIVVNTDTVINKNLVLIEPELVENAVLTGKKIILNISSDEVKSSQSLSSIKEIYEPADKYAWPYYWLGTGGGFPGVTPNSAFGLAPIRLSAKPNQKLVSSRDIAGYKLKTSDGYKFNIREMLLDEVNFNVRYLEVSPAFRLVGYMQVKVNSILGFRMEKEVIRLVDTLAEVKNSNGLSLKENYRFAFNFKSIF
jgi:hypothetical protein